MTSTTADVLGSPPPSVLCMLSDDDDGIGVPFADDESGPSTSIGVDDMAG